jgi:hypothetical protein
VRRAACSSASRPAGGLLDSIAELIDDPVGVAVDRLGDDRAGGERDRHATGTDRPPEMQDTRLREPEPTLAPFAVTYGRRLAAYLPVR